MQRSKQKYQQKITQYGCDHTIKNAEMKQAKNLHHLLSHFTMKKARNKTKNSLKHNIMYATIDIEQSALNVCVKAQNSHTHTHPNKPGQWCQQRKVQI